jgi:YidC/Oxa1 family membrane protein insertase
MEDQKRIFMAVVLSGVILFGWQFMFPPKQDPAGTVQGQAVTSNEINKSDGKTEGLKDNSAIKSSPRDIEQLETSEVVSWSLENEVYRVKINENLFVEEIFNKFSNKGLKEVSGIDFNGLQIIVPNSNGNQQSQFKVNEIRSNKQSLLLESNAGGSIQIVLNGYKIEFSTKGFETPISFKFKALPGSINQFNQRQFIYLANEYESIAIGDEESTIAQTQAFGLDFDYHFFGIGLPDGKANSSISSNIANTFTIQSNISVSELGTKRFNLFLVKKEYDLLSTLGSNLHLTVDFGFFSILALPIFRVLQWCYGFFPNWGVAIIFLTLIIRLLTLPLQYKSAKSMKKVQKLQPELAKLKDKFKEDPQRMQKESMELFKRAGANPISGCFPLLLQMPIFFAFYKVLYNTVELVGSPFYFWIVDLSTKDPFYVLPVLMSVAMFLQQKLTPTTATDPMQQKVMLFMPLVFGFIMKDLPSGLNLYIFVSTVFGIIQQLVLFNRIKE